MAIDYTTPGGQVRLLTVDIDEDNPVFGDAEIAAFLALNNSDVRLAAAQALDATATSEVLVLKVMQTLDTTTDGAKVAAALHAQAVELRRQVSEGIDGGGDFEIADMVVDGHTLRERLVHQLEINASGGVWPFDPEFGF